MTAPYPWQQKSWAYFVSLTQQKRLPHAILLAGINGLGKRAFAEQMIASILCLNTSADAEACGQCHSCTLLAAGNHPDHTEVLPEDAGKAIKVDQIRALKDKQTLMAKVSSAKTVLITPAEAMNVNASNSLLKLLEEPQQDTTFILITEQPERLSITIRSRCQQLNMPMPETAEAIAWLQTQLTEQTEAAWQRLLSLAQGAPLQALALAETGLDDYQQLQQDVALIMRAQANPITIAASWQDKDVVMMLYQMQKMIQAKLTQLLVTQTTDISANTGRYWAIVDCIINTIKLLSSSNNLNKSLLIEAFIVDVMQHAKHIKS